MKRNPYSATDVIELVVEILAIICVVAAIVGLAFTYWPLAALVAGAFLLFIAWRLS